MGNVRSVDMTVIQRETRAIPGSDGSARLRLGDILPLSAAARGEREQMVPLGGQTLCFWVGSQNGMSPSS